MDNKLNYHRRKFDEDVLTKKQEPKCRIWSKEEIQTIIGQLSNSNGAKRSMKQFRVLKAFESMELRYLDPYNMDQSSNSLKVVASEDLFDQIYWSWEQTGFAGWKSLHHKIREQGYYISMEIVRFFGAQSEPPSQN